MADQLTNAAFWNAGQNCTCGSRILVDRSVQDELLEAMSELAPQWKVGDPLTAPRRWDRSSRPPRLTACSPTSTAPSDAGATIVSGGNRVLEDTGGWYRRTDHHRERDAGHGCRARGDLRPSGFGACLRHRGRGGRVGERLQYGLAASIFTHDLDVAHRLAREVRAGTVTVNCYGEGDITTPFGGYKQSGFGGRDKGLEALEQYSELKTTWFALNDRGR